MIPIRLLIQGLYSYQAAQEIDFTRLTEAGLFGIFGPVGSGKSSILEAISFALYGETERLTRQDNRNYNMLNLKSRELRIEFEFRAGSGDGERYLFTAGTKRQKKNFDAVGNMERRAARWDGAEWEPLASADAQSIIGLSYDHFRRTIIIPQNKFQEFLQLSDTQRTDMLMDIFQLRRFNLYFRVKRLREQNALEIENREGRLAGLAGATRKGIEALEQKFAAIEDEIVALEATLDGRKAAEAEVEETRKLIEQRDVQRRRLGALDKRAPEFEQREAALKAFETCRDRFADLVERLEEGRDETAAQVQVLDDRLQRHAEAAESMEHRQAEYTAAQEEFTRRDELLARAEDLMRAVSIRTYDERLAELGEDIGRMEDAMRESESRMREAEAEKSQIAEALSEAQATRPPRDRLEEVRAWHRERETLRAFMAEREQTAAAAEDSVREMAGDTAALAEELYKMAVPNVTQESTAGGLMAGIHAELEHCEESHARLSRERDHLIGLTRLGEFAAALEEGEPCPLCGATHHPAIYDDTEAARKLDALEQEIAALAARQSHLRAIDKRLGELRVRLDDKQKQQQNAVRKVTESIQALAAHEHTWRWAEYERDDPEAVEAALRQARDHDEHIGALESQRTDLDKRLDEIRRGKDKRIADYHAALSRQAEILAQRQLLAELIRIIRLEDVAEQSAKALEREAQELKARAEHAKARHESLGRAVQSLREQCAGLEKEIEAAQRALEKMEKNIARDEERLTARLAEAGFESVTAVREVLAQPIDADAERRAIADYQKAHHAAREQLKALEQQAAGKVYNAQAHASLKEEITRLEESVKTLIGRKGEIASQIERMGADLETRRTLEAEMAQLRERAAGIRTLALLFRKNGFVKYISSVFLEQLCGAANERFRCLTGQQLRLELGAGGGFQVRDFLNDGQARSVKTLSGGQTFQAALSLALALADHIQSLNKANQNFFFIDEGFGSLDRRSLQIVFDTLKALRNENRIVGVISHVDEMQQEIDAHLRIALDPERGSLIQRSWEVGGGA